MCRVTVLIATTAAHSFLLFLDYKHRFFCSSDSLTAKCSLLSVASHLTPTVGSAGRGCERAIETDSSLDSSPTVSLMSLVAVDATVAAAVVADASAIVLAAAAVSV
jgi:hypothetical protein